MPLAVVPMNSAWSSVTIGLVSFTGEVVAKTAVMAQNATSDTRRKAITAKVNDLPVLRGTSEL